MAYQQNVYPQQVQNPQFQGQPMMNPQYQGQPMQYQGQPMQYQGQQMQYAGQYQQGRSPSPQPMYVQQNPPVDNATLSNAGFACLFFFLIFTGAFFVLGIATNGYYGHLCLVSSSCYLAFGIGGVSCLTAIILAVSRLGVNAKNDIGAAQKHYNSAIAMFFVFLVYMAYQTYAYYVYCFSDFGTDFCGFTAHYAGLDFNVVYVALVCGWLHAFCWMFYGIGESSRTSLLRRGQGQVFMAPMMAPVM